jgi:hypothetical protein
MDCSKLSCMATIGARRSQPCRGAECPFGTGGFATRRCFCAWDAPFRKERLSRPGRRRLWPLWTAAAAVRSGTLATLVMGRQRHPRSFGIHPSHPPEPRTPPFPWHRKLSTPLLQRTLHLTQRSSSTRATPLTASRQIPLQSSNPAAYLSRHGL